MTEWLKLDESKRINLREHRESKQGNKENKREWRRDHQ